MLIFVISYLLQNYLKNRNLSFDKRTKEEECMYRGQALGLSRLVTPVSMEERLGKSVGILVLNLHLPSCNNFTANLSLFIKNLTQPTMPTICDKCSAVVSCLSNHLQRRPTCNRLYLSRKKQKTEEEPEDVISIDDNSSVKEDMSDSNEEEDSMGADCHNIIHTMIQTTP